MEPMQVGYARNHREEKRLIEAGLKSAAIYLEGRGNETLARVAVRAGDVLVTVGGLRALGDSRRDMAAMARRFHDQGAAIQDVDTKERSDKRGAEMLDTALAKLHGERTLPNANQAAAMQARSVATRTKGRMAKREALAIWRNEKLTVGDAIAKMVGWSAGTAYRTLGKRDIPTGRRGNKR